jgi:hypothetical protein
MNYVSLQVLVHFLWLTAQGHHRLNCKMQVLVWLTVLVQGQGQGQGSVVTAMLAAPEQHRTSGSEKQGARGRPS